jgi:26S proteasome regulatory subunit N7
MAPYLSHLVSSSLLPDSSDLLSKLEATNKSHLTKLDADLEDAQTNLGETEISDALKAKALYLARIGEKVRHCRAGRVSWRLLADVFRLALSAPHQYFTPSDIALLHQDAALAAHTEALEKTAGLGSKIDLRLAMIRIGLFHGDHKVIQEGIDQAKM